jgi:acyl carrier protein
VVERAEVLVLVQEKLPGTTEETSLEALDSLAVIELVMDLEDALGVEVVEAEVTGTVGDLITHLVGRVP